MSPLLVHHTDDFQPVPAMGGKASALGQLAAAGLPIPEWFVVTPAVFAASDAAESFRLRADLAAEIVAVARSLAPGAGFFAVRSSALDEDSVEHSFAGQLESFLFVPPERIPEKVEAVWRSGFSERILAYRRERGIAGTPQPPAVLVQRMINADSAGVAFSADPVSGRRGNAVVSAVFGLGTTLVSGLADSDTFGVDRRGRVVSRAIAEKRIAHRAAPDQPEGILSEQLPAGDGSQPALSDAQAAEVAKLARISERHFGRPQDIEWALAEGKLWLLQSRPITSLAALADPDGELNLWDNANIAESYSGVTTPLTFSFARGIYESVYREFARLMGVSAARIEENRDLFPRMLGLIEGRIYYNLLSWYRLLALLPGFSVNRGFMEQMMGVKEGLPDEALARLAPSGRWAKVRDGFALLRACLGLVRNHFKLPDQIARFYERLNHALRPCDSPLEEQRPDELANHFRDLERQLLLRWDAPLVNDFFAMIFYGVTRKLTAKWCNDGDGTLQNDLLCAEGGMISAEPAKRVRELAAMVAGDAGAVEILCNNPLQAIERWLKMAPEFRARYEAYLAKFGDRCLEELKLESLTLHDEPLTLLRSIGQFARRFSKAGLEDDGGAEAKLRAQAEGQVARTLSTRPLHRAVFAWVLKHARARVRDRENLRFERTRLFGRVRRIYVELGKRLNAAGRLEDPRDVFYLTVEEVLGFVEGTTATTDLLGLAELRRREFARFREKSPPADRFATRGAVHLGNAFRASQIAVAPSGDTLKGIGCCPGVVRGRARLITEPRNAVIEPGEILVAPRTDPGWIMLFPAAAGLLVEHGSLLSHSAIVARELGIPAIVSISGVTAWLRTGDWLEMDGSTGSVRKIEAPPA
jgi:phosphohistidine swiveling domain-containing protein